ncbi:MAG: hypothetical protein RDV41_12105 [Planctomycetota bacterium]|nr:hypothetical protein [Planctomycetota bacterium]
MEPVRYFAKLRPDGHIPVPNAVKEEGVRVFEVILMPVAPGQEIYGRMEEIVEARHIPAYSLEQVAEIVQLVRDGKEC